ncbi:MAG: glycosyltransferase family 39 protein, partial [Thermoanaerobaculia bacterium]|nr:glycosyltransferase family 39 protein [Thermoanaerobaculia bacterium]
MRSPADGAPEPAGGRSSRPRRALLLVVLAAALGLELWVAQADPTHRKAYDERFTVRNAAWMLDTGRLWPENGFHPSLSYLPHLIPLAASEALYRGTGREALRVLERRPLNRITREGKADSLAFTPTGYVLARGVNCLIGVASLLLTCLVARRVLGEPVGVLAAFLLAAVPWHLRQAAVLKPDIVLVATLMLAVWAALVAVERRRLSSYLLAGAAVGLCLSSKFNGAPAAVPLVAGTLLVLRRDRSVALKLMAAGGDRGGGLPRPQHVAAARLR